MKDYQIIYRISERDFQDTFKRKPQSAAEFEAFGDICKKGLEAQLDWDMIYQCSKDALYTKNIRPTEHHLVKVHEMRKVIVNINMEIPAQEAKTEREAIEIAENYQLPKEYVPDSFEIVKVLYE